MNTPESIICRPTRWFLIRALAMLAMFGVFTVWFLYDAEIGYRAKNEAFFTERAFHQAVTEFNEFDSAGDLTPEEWRRHAETREISFPDDEGILPRSLEQPVPWPDILHDYEKVRPLNPRAIWIEYTGELGISDKVPDEYFTPRKINEQWVVFWICLVLTLVTLFFLVRTLRRRIVVDDEGVTDATGRRVAHEDLTLLDLRKWDTKGIAFAEYQSPSGTGRMRLDGLTYGGFRHEDDQPAERMMEKLRAHFTGEIIEYSSGEEEAGNDAETGNGSGETPEDPDGDRRKEAAQPGEPPGGKA